jgi:chromosome segregation protein
VEAEAAAASFRAELQQAEAAAEAATRAESEARLARRSADQAATEAARDLTRAETALEALEGKASGLQSASRRRGEELATARAGLKTAEDAVAALADASQAKAEVEAERVRLEAARISAMTRQSEAEEISRAGAARDRRLGEIAGEIDGWTARQATATRRLQDLAERETSAQQDLATLRARPSELAARRSDLAKSLDAAEARRRAASDALATAESELRSRDTAAREAERAASEAREARARSEALAEAAEARAAAAADRLRADLEREPGDVLADFAIDAEAVPSGTDLDVEVDRLRRQRDALGAVNLRAEEDAREIAAEREELARERDDLDDAIAKLSQGIASLNREGRGRLLAAFDEVNRNFAVLFKHLFGGGEASLVMVESDDPLEAGLEIMCQPPGKKLSTLSLLSGGEQTLTALSLIFGVFLANPSPICVLDEVDAPLDDANVTRFCDLLDEMTERTATRFLIITHHAITMSRMARLFGVTMGEKGVSQLVSVDLAAAERIVESV